MTRLNKERFMFIILEMFYDPENGYKVMVKYENDPDLHSTSLYWGHDYDLAIEYAFERNILNRWTIEEIHQLSQSASFLHTGLYLEKPYTNKHYH